MGFARNFVSAVTTAVCLASLLAGCATAPPADDPDAVAEYKENNDPLEPTNRVIYDINDSIDSAVFVPIAKGYRFAVPEPVRHGVHNLLTNISSVPVLANDLLQGNLDGAGDTFARLAINTTIGLGGIIDVANDWGIRQHDADFGMTMALWGVDPGPFLFLPLLGPSNPRDLGGYVGDIAFDPVTYMTGPNWRLFSYSRFGAKAIDARERHLDDLEEIKKNALDPYATWRSLYNQNRAQQIEQARQAREAASGAKDDQ